MSIITGLALFFVIWWIVLFTTLPFGVKSQVEAEDVVAGSEPGAPVAPMLRKKMLWTTAITAVLFSAVVWALGRFEI